jgi:hypothetical protein
MEYAVIETKKVMAYTIRNETNRSITRNPCVPLITRSSINTREAVRNIKKGEKCHR